MKVNSAAMPPNKASRHHLITELLDVHDVTSQALLAELLAQSQVSATQATISRDLEELGAEKVRTPDGRLVYRIPQQEPGSGPRSSREELFAPDARLAGILSAVLVSAEASANLAVLRTPPGAAQYLAAALDRSILPGLLGTVGGDDTILLISDSATGGADLAARLLEMAGRLREESSPRAEDRTEHGEDRSASPEAPHDPSRAPSTDHGSSSEQKEES